MSAAVTDGFDPFGLHGSGPAVGHRVVSPDVRPVREEKRLLRLHPRDGVNFAAHRRPSHIAPQSAVDDADKLLFDPFGLSASSSGSHDPPQVSRITRNNMTSSSAQAAAAASSQSSPGTTCTSTVVLPPKMVIKLSVHEEVSSLAAQDGVVGSCEGASEVAVEGTILAQVQSSDGKKNAPFVICSTRQVSNLNFLPDNKLSKSIVIADSNNKGMLVTVPKEEIGFVPVGNYTITEQVPHMPVLLERKVTMQNTTVRIAVQVRSKLNNLGDMEDFTIAVAVPEHVDARSVKVLRGDGVWDDLKRIIKWRLASLKQGESYMVTAQAKLWKPPDTAGATISTTAINFPVLLRCSATADQVSNIDLQVVQADGHPASLTVSKTYGFRLLHRLT